MPERYHVKITTRASDDILGICSYIEQDSPQNAAAIAQELLDAIDSLELLPHRYKVHENSNDPTRTVHAMPVSPFIVYYRVSDAVRLVDVIAVLHGRRQQPLQFE